VVLKGALIYSSILLSSGPTVLIDLILFPSPFLIRLDTPVPVTCFLLPTSTT
jgi:hypothetical protein